MRISRLSLHAFGPFTGAELDLGTEPAMHVIYGPNEAGKSTTLRALIGLLYGIPSTTGDAHLHRMPDLLLGATLCRNGESIEVLRRKGTKNTLFSASEPESPSEREPLDELTMRDLLGGVDEATFRAMFGLDHETLRLGAEALLAGRGAVGESLFDAGVGGRGIQNVLGALREEADELFKPRGRNQKINEGLRAWREARDRRLHESVRPEAWTIQVEELEALRIESAAANRALRERKAEQSALQRIRRVLPLLAKRRDQIERRTKLGDVALLAAGARDQRLEAQFGLEQAERDRKRALREIEARREQLAALAIREDVAALEAEAVDHLADRLGSYRKAVADLPKRSAELAALEREVEALAAAAGRAPDSVSGDVLAQTRIRRLATSKGEIATLVDGQRRRLDELLASQERLRQRVAAVEVGEGFEELRAALDAARAVTDLPARVAELDTEIADLGEEVAAQLARLRPRIKAQALLSASLPAQSLVDRFARERDRLDRDGDDLDRRLASLAERTRDNRRQLRAFENAGKVPDEADLESSRRKRDELWQKIRGAKAAVAKRPADRLESAIAAADGIADRLRREAGRVATLGELRAGTMALAEEEAELERAREELAGRRADHDARWRELWSDVGVEPGEPAAMSEWVGSATAVGEVGARRATAERDRARADQRLGECRAALTAQLRAARQRAARTESLAGLVERAATLLDEQAERVRELRTNQQALGELDGKIEAARRELESGTASLDRWRADWSQSLRALGMPDSLESDEALAMLESLNALAARSAELEQMQARVAAIRADEQAFASEVAALAAAHAPELAQRPAAEAAERLRALYRETATAIETRKRIENELADRKAEVASADERVDEMTARLAALMAAAQVADLPALIAAETESDEALALDRAIAQTEAELLDAGEGASIDDLSARARDVDIDQVRARLGELENEIETIGDEVARLASDIGGKTVGLRHLEERVGAAAAADDEQAVLASLRENVERYVRVKLAAELLEAEVERYRQRHQDPILIKANRHFPVLTLGRYAELRVGYDQRDEPVLRCVRADGAEVGVEALSDGTRDQLYLALRLATLERFAESAEPLPLVLDDVLIHFDDQRAAAALEVLGEIAKSTQILFFTHHERLLELARAAVPAERLREHDLMAVRAAAVGA